MPTMQISSPVWEGDTYILTLPDSKHLSPTRGTYPLSRRPAVLHSYGLSVLHFPFGAAFHTVCLH